MMLRQMPTLGHCGRTSEMDGGPSPGGSNKHTEPELHSKTTLGRQSLLGFLTMLRLEASTPRDALLTASRGRMGFLYIHSPPSTTRVAPAEHNCLLFAIAAEIST